MSRSGTTLIELLITLATLSVALALMAGLVSEYQRLLFRDSSDSLVAAQFQQVSLLRTELSQATQVIQPAGSAPIAEVLFIRVDPQAPRLDSIPTPAQWVPQSPQLALEVRYYLDSQLLRRATRKQGLPVSDEVLLQSVSGFTARKESDGRLVLSFSFLERDVLRTLSCEVLPWVR